MVRSKPANSPWQRLPPGRTGLLSERFPRYAPELNDIEVVWHDHLARIRPLLTTDALDRAIHQAVDALNTERMVLLLARPRISP